MPPLSLDALLLRALRDHRHLTGAELARKIRSASGTVRTRIAILRDAGYTIKEHPHHGYRLVSAPDRLIGDDILSRLEETRLIREIIVFEETNSTNDVAAALGRGGAAAGTVIFAEKQSSGRGRLGRRWESASGLGLWFSLLLRPELPFELWPRLTTCAAVAVASGIEAATQSRASIKWPNDIFVGSRKVAGILTETQIDTNGNAFVVIGIGVNINQVEDDFQESIRGTAGSLRMDAGSPVGRHAVAAAILQLLDAVYLSMDSGFPAIIKEARRRSYLAGRVVETGARKGTVEGLDTEGALLLRTAEGELIAVRTGEVAEPGATIKII